jgi:hypothetical protein
MSLEDRLTQSLDEGLARLDAAPAGLADVERRARGVRRRRTVVAGVAVAAVVAAIAIIVPRLGDDRVDPAPPTGSWHELPDLPLSPRADSVTAWTGTEALVIGGYLTLCPPAASCKHVDEMAQDGAAYDPETETWREIAEAPVPMANYFRSTMVGDMLVIFDGQDEWFAYDVSNDEWRDLPSPRQDVVDSGSLTAAGGFVYVIGRPGPVLGLDVADARWVVLPDAFLGGARAQTIVATTQGLVLSGTWADGSPETVVAQVWDGSTRRPIQTGQLNPFRHWTGEHLVELDLQTMDNDDGTTTPYGGRLDPHTGQWSPLPDPPPESGGGGWSPVAADGPLIAGWGFVYDDRDQTWTRVGRPAGAVAQLGLSAVWADGRLLVFGGADSRSKPTGQAWAWTP